MPNSSATRIRTSAAGAALIVAATLAAYANSFRGAFVFDDGVAIQENPALRHLWPLWPVLFPPHGGVTSSGRPLLSLSLAVNYAIGGTNPWGYHLFNLLVHILASLVLFGLARRTFARLALPAVGSGLYALALALLWAVHPLQTESVTYVVQRAEAMMGLFYLLTLYGFIRCAENSGSAARRWGALSCASCLLGCATKEVMVSAPVIVLLYDCAFVSPSFREAWRRHRGVYLGLAASWVLLAVLVIQGGGNRGGTIGFGLGVSWAAYALTQFGAVAHYLRLALWPHPLVLDYGTPWVRSPLAVFPWAALVVALIAGTFLAWRRGLAREGPGGTRRALGFAGAWFFAILAPTSLVPGIRQIMSEHRMYLALIPVLALGVSALGWTAAAAGRRLGPKGPLRLFAGATLLAGAAFGLLTFRRNTIYRSDLAVWSDTVVRVPDNPYARRALGQALTLRGRDREALAEYERALEINPRYTDALNASGIALARLGRPAEAVARFDAALRLDPRDWLAEANLANALRSLGQPKAALGHSEKAVVLHPDAPELQLNLGATFRAVGRLQEAETHLREALRLQPDYAEAHNDLGDVLRASGRSDEALAQYRLALRFNPRLATAHSNLGLVLTAGGHVPEAIRELQEAIRIDPDFAEAENNLGTALLASRRIPEAIGHYRAAIRIKPGYLDARGNLAAALTLAGRFSEAIAEYERLLPLLPRNPDLRYNYAQALRSAGRAEEAKTQLEESERLEASATR